MFLIDSLFLFELLKSLDKYLNKSKEAFLIQNNCQEFKMNNTPQKTQNANSKEIKASGKRIPQNEPAQASSSLPPQNRIGLVIEKIKKHYIITTIVISFILLACLLTPAIIFLTKKNNQIIIIEGSRMYSQLQNGGKFSSKAMQIKKGPSQSAVQLTINKVQPANTAIRSLQQVQSGSTATSQINYYHKDSQISFAYDSKLNFQVRIPADTGIGYVVANAPPSSDEALQKIAEVLPKILTNEIEKTSGKKAKMTIELSYDGVYSKQKNDYTILTQKISYHPDEFAKISANETNLNDKKPAVSNYSNVTEVSKAIAETVSNIAGNLKQVILENKERLETQVGPITETKAEAAITSTQSSDAPVKINDEIAKCTRVGSEVIRCPENVWKSGELKVSNPNPVEPLEVWEIVVEAKS